ncbi:COG3178: Predicted phosphotransferase related to Ser/Thr protein kinases [Halomonas citrativorans]|uniref:COG3178: Predicted phosphotransferase related to Ser/Thr protein kinases n=1 Tax=Halomonas citrativorans TaxID=2742612 RepID=A0A1R4I7F6_9GAMM|nr:phosphotransferase [Halomonas citrativorans]SJN15233.1 COG3178: Predicted phosphotransferase related to Ser/Thr protein kinases [Halomonas citrativorans]
MSSLRIDALTRWAAEQNSLNPALITLSPAGGDASFRGYFRLTLPNGDTQIVMDAPPAQEDSAPFVAIGNRWYAAGLPVPKIYAANLDDGFLLLDDLGSTPMQNRFTDSAAVIQYHEKALALIAELQNRASPTALPDYDATLLARELDLFPEWCMDKWLTLPCPSSWEALRTDLIHRALQQPTVSVHRDFDAMNIMINHGRLYMIDFQDAVAGPITYDVISLLRGRYWRFSATQFAELATLFYRQARSDGRLSSVLTKADFITQCHAMSAQRSLKVLGIFCRLTLRDYKQGYLARLPHFLDHLEDSLNGLPEHAAFANWVRLTLRPAILQRLAEEHP